MIDDQPDPTQSAREIRYIREEFQSQINELKESIEMLQRSIATLTTQEDVKVPQSGDMKRWHRLDCMFCNYCHDKICTRKGMSIYDVEDCDQPELWKKEGSE